MLRSHWIVEKWIKKLMLHNFDCRRINGAFFPPSKFIHWHYCHPCLIRIASPQLFLHLFESFIWFLLPRRQLNQFAMFPFIVLSQQIDFYVYKHIFIAAMGQMCKRTHSVLCIWFTKKIPRYVLHSVEKHCIKTVTKWKIEWNSNPHVGSQRTYNCISNI